MCGIVASAGASFQCCFRAQALIPLRVPGPDQIQGTFAQKILSDGAIYLQKFDWSAGNLDERDHHLGAGAVRRR